MIVICCWRKCCVQTSTFQCFFKYRISGILCSRYESTRFQYLLHCW